jgi:hypothetical protein
VEVRLHQEVHKAHLHKEMMVVDNATAVQADLNDKMKLERTE